MTKLTREQIFKRLDAKIRNGDFRKQTTDQVLLNFLHRDAPIGEREAELVKALLFSASDGALDVLVERFSLETPAVVPTKTEPAA